MKAIGLEEYLNNKKSDHISNINFSGYIHGNIKEAEWYGVKIVENIKEKEIKWYDLIECKYCHSINARTMYLPASFLKIKGILPENIDLGDDRQYKLDFNSLKKDGKTIDELFNDYVKNKQRPQYSDMLEFCRFLYRKQSYLYSNQSSSNDVSVPYDQMKDQFRREFMILVKNLKFENLLKQKSYDENNWHDEYIWCMRDLFKIFILFRASKIKNIDYPLDSSREYLPDEANVIELENILSIEKDNCSVASLNGLGGSANGIYISKLYALLWTNLNMYDNEIRVVLDYINYVELSSFELINKNLGNIVAEILQDKLMAKCIENKDMIMSFKDEILLKMDKLVKYKEFDLREFFILYGVKISIFAYYILKIYIENERKKNNWKILSCKIGGFLVDVNISKEDLQKIYQVTEKVDLKSFDEVINNLTRNKSVLTNEEQNMILNFIFPNDNRKKEKKRNELINNCKKISMVYGLYVMNQGLSNMAVEWNHFYNLIISSYIFANIKNIKIDNIKYKNFMKDCMDKRRKNIGSLFCQIIKNKFENQSFKEVDVNFVYFEIARFLVNKYKALFEVEIPKNVNKIDDFMEIYDVVDRFWEEALNEAYKVAIVDKKGVS